MTSQNGSILPSPDILNDLEYGKFVLSNLAAKRAKQLRDGAPPLVKIDSNHPLSIALAEIAAGKIKPGPIVEPDISIEADLGIPVEGTPGSELGILLPALDEDTAELLGVAALVADETDEHHDEDGDVGSLSDLLAEEESVVVEADDDTLSLSEVAEQEESAAAEADEPAE
jgi:DNA-directed RNA polymerase subunit omega